MSARPEIDTPSEIEVSTGDVTSVRGFSAGGDRCGLKESGRRDVGGVLSDRPATAAGVFTTNKVKAAPVLLCQEVLAATASAGATVRAIVFNSGNANAMTGAPGLAHARQMQQAFAEGPGAAERGASGRGLRRLHRRDRRPPGHGQAAPRNPRPLPLPAGRRGGRGSDDDHGHRPQDRLRSLRPPPRARRCRGRVTPCRAREHDHRGRDGQGRGDDRPPHGHHAGLHRHRRRRLPAYFKRPSARRSRTAST